MPNPQTQQIRRPQARDSEVAVKRSMAIERFLEGERKSDR